MRCPVCREPLLTCEYEDIEADFCPACAGVWLDADELALLMGRESTKAFVSRGESRARETKRPCPRCRTRMDKRVAEGVLVDTCPRGHGVWLDRGELEALRDGEQADDRAQHVRRWLKETFRQ